MKNKVIFLNKIYLNLKSIQKNNKLPHTYFLEKFSFSPYRACYHGCKYCDGRAERYYVEGDYDNDIQIRFNCAELLEKTLISSREKGIVNISSGVSDCYQPVESTEKLMPKCLEVIDSLGFSASILTKSSLPMRDIDIISSINSNSGFILYVSINTLNDDIRKIMEPNASKISQRLKMIEAFSLKGITVVALTMPFLPYICDRDSEIYSLFKQLKDIGVSAIMPGYLTLRPGIQKNTYMHSVNTHFHGSYDKYIKLYEDNLPSGEGKRDYYESKNKVIYQMLNSLKLPSNVPHYAYKKSFEKYDELYILMTHMISIYKSKNHDTTPLYRIRKSYSDWLLNEKEIFGRSKSMTGSDITKKLQNLILSESTSDIEGVFHGNKKFMSFINEAIFDDNKYFDYTTLKLNTKE